MKARLGGHEASFTFDRARIVLKLAAGFRKADNGGGIVRADLPISDWSLFDHQLPGRCRRRYLNQLGDKLRAEGLQVATTTLIGAGLATTILRHLAEEPFDIVALTTHGAGGFRHLILGSVADKVVRGATKPVLIYRPPRTAGR
ncbi:MAG: universal stress protein [Gemmatimonadota bacterium]